MKRLIESFIIAAALSSCAKDAPKDAQFGSEDASLSMFPPSTQTSTEPALAMPSGPTFKLATYNVNFGLAGDPATVAAIRGLDVDVIFLQETNAAWEHALASLKTSYPHMAFRHCCNAGGLAVLSKRPFSEKEYIHPEGAWFPAWRVIVESELGALQVVNVHLRPNISDSGSVVGGLFTTPAIREKEIAHYLQAVDSKLPAVFVGDFNETADGLAMQQLNALGMRSALPEVGGRQYTWQWQTSLGRIRQQLDHIVFDERLEVVTARVELEGSSDHFPVVATLRARH